MGSDTVPAAAAAAAIPTPAGVPRGGSRCLSPLLMRRKSSVIAAAAGASAASRAPSPERKALNEVQKLLEEAESDGEQRIDIQKLKKAVAAVAAVSTCEGQISAPAVRRNSRTQYVSTDVTTSSSKIATTPSVGQSTASPTQTLRKKSSIVGSFPADSLSEGKKKVAVSLSAAKAASGHNSDDNGGGGGLRRKSSIAMKTKKTSSTPAAETLGCESTVGPVEPAAAAPGRRVSSSNPSRRRSSTTLDKKRGMDKEMIMAPTAAATSSAEANDQTDKVEGVDDDIVSAAAEAEKIFQKLVLM